jgi:hypothetical protein
MTIVRKICGSAGYFRRVVGCLVLWLVFGSLVVRAEERASVLARVSADLAYLASEELDGRGPGTEGRQKAAEYIRDEFQRMGLNSGVEDGSYLQPFQMPLATEVVPDQTRLVLLGPEDQTLPLELGTGFQPLAVGGGGQAKAELVFAGYGISAPDLNYDDYDGLESEGKILLILRHEPQQDDDQSVFDGKKTTTHSYIRTKLQLAKKQKVAAVLLVNDPFSVQQAGQDQLTVPSGFGTNSLGVPFLHVTQATVNQMLGQTPLRTADGRLLSSLAEVAAEIDETGKPISQPLEDWSVDLQTAFRKVQVDLANVIGVLDGEGPLAEETIVLGAHYDHLGFGEYGSRRPSERAVHYGADDNASGTAAIIELARRYAARAERPARRLVFVAFDAEERGLIGSKHYVDHPSFPLADTVAMLNFDMVGRLRNAELTVMGSGTAAEFESLLDRAAESSGLTLKKSPRVTAQSDHYPFFQRDIPALHFFTGMHPDYHTPEDTFERINMDGVLQTVDFSEQFLDAVLALPQRPRLVKAGAKGQPGGGVAYLGITPDYSSEAEGLTIVSVAPDSPAEKGGLQAQDVITHFAGKAVADLPALTAGLRENKPGDTVNVTVQRDGQAVSCSVTLGSSP